MARITPFSTEECRSKIPSQFEIAIIAAKRVRELNAGGTPKTNKEPEETNRSLAMREIAEGKIGIEYLKKG